MLEVDVPLLPLARLEPALSSDQYAATLAAAERARVEFARRRLIHVSSTATGGGVAEMLRGLLGYARDAGVECRWLVVQGEPAFFDVTKRLHNGLHGAAGDGGPLGPHERATYQRTLDDQAASMRSLIRPGDVVVLHDPQTLGLVDAAHASGAPVVWRCHIGTEDANEWTDRAWGFLRPDVERAEVSVFSRREYAPGWLPAERVVVIPPSIDPVSTKNRDLGEDLVRSVLAAAGVLAAGPAQVAPSVSAPDGRRIGVSRRADLIGEDGPLGPDAPLVVQVSRWDRLKDMGGVLEAFTLTPDAAGGTAHLVLAGPAVDGVSDDPEGARVLAEVTAQWRDLPPGTRRGISLVTIPMDDVEENALVVNALQRQAAVVVQKSLQEGFGLTVAEAMWKRRPVVASAVGGIRDQVEDGVNGRLVDPRDGVAFARAVHDLLSDSAKAERLGAAARDRVQQHFLPPRQLIDWLTLLTGRVDPTFQASSG
jgi:trehalose synthase